MRLATKLLGLKLFEHLHTFRIYDLHEGISQKTIPNQKERFSSLSNYYHSTDTFQSGLR